VDQTLLDINLFIQELDTIALFSKSCSIIVKNNERNNELRAHKAVKVILTKKISVFNKVINYFKGDVKVATTALWGLSFKLKPMTCVKLFYYT
jgi:UDP-glucose 6-dehydrogenase